MASQPCKDEYRTEVSRGKLPDTNVSAVSSAENRNTVTTGKRDSAVESTAKRVDALDRDLWAASHSMRAAVQVITECRHERVAVYGALNQANIARDNLERSISIVQKRYDALSAGYDALYGHYSALHAQNETLQDQYTRLHDDFQKVMREQADLQAIRSELQSELLTLKDKTDLELRTRDIAIEDFQELVNKKDVTLVETEEKLEQELKDHFRLMRDIDAKAADIAGLKATVVAHELNLSKLQGEVVALTSEKESAARIIERLQGTQKETERIHANSTRQLREENDSLRAGLEEAAESKRELGESMDAIEEWFAKEKAQLNESLTQKLETVTQVLVARFPELHEDLGNLATVLNREREEGKRKKRRCAK